MEGFEDLPLDGSDTEELPQEEEEQKFKFQLVKDGVNHVGITDADGVLYNFDNGETFHQLRLSGAGIEGDAIHEKIELPDGSLIDADEWIEQKRKGMIPKDEY